MFKNSKFFLTVLTVLFMTAFFMAPVFAEEATVTLTVSPAGESTAGETITLEADTDVVDAEYQFYFRIAGGRWGVLGARQAENTLEIPIPASYGGGDFQFAVLVFEEGAAEWSEYGIVAHTIKPAEVSVTLEITPSGQSELGEPVTMSATAEGVQDPRFMYGRAYADGVWGGTGYMRLDTLDGYKPQQLGTMRFAVAVREAGSSTVLGVAIVEHEVVEEAAPPEPGSVPAAAIEALAAELYDELEKANGDPSAVIRDIVDSLGLYKGLSASLAEIKAQLAQGAPVYLEDHVLTMADAYQTGMMVDLETYIQAMVLQGAYNRNPRGPLTSDYLAGHLSPLLTRSEYPLEEVAPALILYLGHERASRSNNKVDPVWADNLLDPLQLSLLTYLIILSSDQTVQDLAAEAAALKGTDRQQDNDLPIPNTSTLFAGNNTSLSSQDDWRSILGGLFSTQTWTSGRAAEFMTEIIGTTDYDLKKVMCFIIVLYGYNVTLEVEHNEINKIWEENPAGSSPYETDLTARLRFNYVPSNIVSEELFDGECDDIIIPTVGPVAGKSIEWTMSGELRGHGTFGGSINDHTFDNNGVAKATYRASTEIAKLYRRGSPEVATGQLHVNVGELLPANWRNLEVVTQYYGQSAMAAKPVKVNYYEYPELILDFRSSQMVTGGHPYAVTYTGLFTAQVPLDPKRQEIANGVFAYYYEGTGALLYENSLFVLDGFSTASYQRFDGEIGIETDVFPDLGSYYGIFKGYFTIIQAPYGMATLIDDESGTMVDWPSHYGVGALVAPHAMKFERLKFDPYWQYHEGSNILATNSYSLSETTGGTHLHTAVEVELRFR